MPTFLSADQFQTILETPNAARRAGLGKRLFIDFDAGMLDMQERQAGLSIFRALARDDNDEVRRDFARFVAQFQDVPADLANTIANDPVRRIAVPFLRLGVGIGDDVLVDVVGWRQRAVAGRGIVNVPVSAAISEVGEAGAVKTLLNNPGAALPSAILGRIAERFGDDDDIAALLLENPRVPGRYVETQIHAVSHRLKAFVDRTGWIDAKNSSGALANAVEHSLVEFAVGRSRAEMMPIFAKWVAERRITRGFVLRAACYGAISLLDCLPSGSRHSWPMPADTVGKALLPGQVLMTGKRNSSPRPSPVLWTNAAAFFLTNGAGRWLGALKMFWGMHPRRKIFHRFWRDLRPILTLWRQFQTVRL